MVFAHAQMVNDSMLVLLLLSKYGYDDAPQSAKHCNYAALLQPLM